MRPGRCIVKPHLSTRLDQGLNNRWHPQKCSEHQRGEPSCCALMVDGGAIAGNQPDNHIERRRVVTTIHDCQHECRAVKSTRAQRAGSDVKGTLNQDWVERCCCRAQQQVRSTCRDTYSGTRHPGSAGGQGEVWFGFSDGRVLFRPRLGDLAFAGEPGKLSRHA